MNPQKIQVAAVIACRVSSTRLFCKPLQLVDNRSILELIILQLKKSNCIKDIVLAISDKPGNEIFVEFARENSIKFIRGGEEDVLKRIISGAKMVKADIVVRVTSEDPFKYWHIIDKTIIDHIKSGSDLTFIENLPVGVGFEIVNLKSLIKSHKKSTKNDKEHVTSYIYKHQKDFKIKNFIVRPMFRRPELRLTVDYPEDLILVRKIMAKLRSKYLPNIVEIIQVLDRFPKLKEINKEFVKR